ncbi:HD-GYP domain-containing protein [Bacillus salitolerans]|uniref:HD-GYP domain-containing protein n=1 Tax=Bacillus salitolerans TaxID=1437434 RepID=A0ABW4LSE1_9BACI
MRLISISDYNHATMQLGRPVYDNQKRILLTAGRTIDPRYLKRLEDMDIRYLFVEDSVSEGITMDEMMDMPTWLDAIEAVQQVYKVAATNKPFELKDIQQMTNKLIDEVNKRKAIVLIPTTSIAEDLRPYAHSVNVALLALQVGKKLSSINNLQMRDLALGVLLHDIGKAITSNDENHPQTGFDYLRKVRGLSLLSAHVAFQHHEQFNGTGFPRGITGKEFHEYAQLCGICNLYDNMISRDHIPPHMAMEMIMTKSNVGFSEEIVHAFIHSIPSYTPGTKVVLSNGEKAIVTKIKSHMQRPVIRIIESNKEVSLEEDHTLLITGTFDEK